MKDLIEKAYKVFEKYKIGKTLNICTFCCVTPESMKELINTPLRSVSSELINRGYYQSARNYSDEELLEMKHFLPRVLELVSNFEFPYDIPELVFDRLNLDQSEKWPEEEIELLEQFAILHFDQTLKVYKEKEEDPLGKRGISRCLIMFGASHFDLNPILSIWENDTSATSLLYFKDLILYEIEYNVQNPYKLKNTFSTELVDNCLINWLNNPNTKNKFASRIEQELANNHNLDEQQLEELSWTYEFLKR